LNCCGITAFGVVRTSSSAVAIEHDLGAEKRQHLAPFDRHRFRHHQL
jgi:hypothetical protein